MFSVQLRSVEDAFIFYSISEEKQACVWTAGRGEREREGTRTRDRHQKHSAEPRHTQRAQTHTRRRTRDTDQIALIGIVPAEFVRFLCHLEARRSG